MQISSLIVLVVLFFATSVVGVVTGSNSLITVPAMFQFGIDEKVAVATNMFGLTFMAIGGTIPFIRRRTINARSLTPLIILTVIGSAIGAALVGLVTNSAIRLIVIIGMIVVTIFTIFGAKSPGRTVTDAPEIADEPASKSVGVRPTITILVAVCTFLLAIYGGLYSGGYVTVLTAVLVAFSGLSFTESIGATKLINVFSSGIATIIFMWQGLVDYKLGLILAVAMFAGAFVGAHVAVRMNDAWLKRIFLTTVLILAVKTLVDFI